MENQNLNSEQLPQSSEDQGVTQSSSVTISELASTLGAKAQAFRLHTEKSITGSNARRSRVPNPVYLDIDVFNLISNSPAIMAEFTFEAGGRAGLFLPGADNLTFEFAPLFVIEAEIPAFVTTEPELASVVSKPQDGTAIVFLGSAFEVADDSDKAKKGRFSSIKIKRLRSNFEITGVGKRIAS